MKRFRTISVLLVSLLVLSVVILPNSPKAEALQEPTYKNDVPALAPKSDFLYRTQNNRIFITKYIGTNEKIIIPETIDNLPVFAVTSKAFADSGITYIKLPAALGNLASNAFNECDTLLRIDVDDSNPYFCSVDGVVYSKDRTILKVFPAGRGGDFTIPNGVTTVSNFAFYRCYQVENINMYNTVTSIGERAFSFCWNLRSVRFSDNLETIGALAFSHCDDLTELRLPKSIKSIGTDAFLGKINSNDSSKEYYLIDGVYALKGSYPARYIKSLGLNYINSSPTITNVKAGVTITDIENVIPAGTELKVDVHPLSSVDADFSDLKYTEGYVLDIYLSKNGSVYVPTGEFKINFDNSSKNLIPTATKVFSSRVGDVEILTNQPDLKSTTFETDTLGTYVVLLSNDFSLKGDANGDGAVTLTDARIALLASANIVKLTDEQIKTCDFVTAGADKNVITTADTRAILRTAAGIK
jgi:hypothetical protein